MTFRIRNRRFAFAVVIAASGTACAPTAPEAPAARPVRVETVASPAAPDARRYSATLQPRAQVGVAFEAGGTVVELGQSSGRALQAGDVVTRGRVLARLDDADYRARVDQAKAQLAEAEAGLVRARADAGRAEALYAERALTRPDYDAAIASLGAGIARVDAARAQLAAAELALRDTLLVAPSDGVILSRSAELGALAGAGTVAFALGDLSEVKAVFGVPDRALESLAIGTPLLLTSDAFGPKGISGTVSAISPIADTQSRVFGVEVTIPNPGGRLRAGMIATVEGGAPATLDASAPQVDVSAVVRSAHPGGYAVFVAEGDGDETAVRARDVTLGALAGNRVAVDSGLRVGERVVVSGAGLLADGDRVRIIPGAQGE